MKKKSMSRRDSMKLLSGAAALGASLGIPSAAQAAVRGGRLQYKIELSNGRMSEVLHTWEVPDRVVATMLRGEGRLQIKWYDSETREYVGAQEIDRRQIKIDG